MTGTIPVLTAAEMREVDARTIALGIPGSILMENAGHRVVEFLESRYAPLSRQRVVILCGKGNNGGDGYVIGRQLWTRFGCASLHVVSVFGDDAGSEPRRMLEATGCPVHDAVTAAMRNATLVIDAVLGTGVSGAARGRALEAIREINGGFPLADIVAVDLPSGMNADGGSTEGEVARANATVTFTAPKLCHVLGPNCDRLGELRVTQIGSPASLMEGARLHLNHPAAFAARLLGARAAESNKGTYGHVLVVGGAEGKSGAAEMAGMAALRVGAGLVTVASSVPRLNTLELMTESLPMQLSELQRLTERRDVVAIGPGLGTSPDAVRMVREAVEQLALPMVLDADALNALAGHGGWRSPAGQVRVLTPHPGEMSRLAGLTVAEVQADRVGVARAYAEAHDCVVVLKGHRTVIALPAGHAVVNPTGSPAMATGGTGDVLTGMIAGLLGQAAAMEAVLAGVWLHGHAGEIGAAQLGEQGLLATDLLTYLPEAIRDARNLAHRD